MARTGGGGEEGAQAREGPSPQEKLSLQGLSATEPRTLWTSLIRRVAGSRSRLGDMHSAASRPWSWAAGF